MIYSSHDDTSNPRSSLNCSHACKIDKSQEFIMTNTYVDKQGRVTKMPSTLFLVFMNRVVAMVFSAGLVSLRGQPLFFVGSTDAIWPAAP